METNLKEELITKKNHQKNHDLCNTWYRIFMVFVTMMLSHLVYYKSSEILLIKESMRCIEVRKGYFIKHDKIRLTKNVIVYFEDVYDKAVFDYMLSENNETLDTRLIPNLRTKTNCHIIMA